MGDFVTVPTRPLQAINPSSEARATQQAILDLRAALIAALARIAALEAKVP